MDRDIEMSLEQQHTKKMTHIISRYVLATIAAVCLSATTCESISDHEKTKQSATDAAKAQADAMKAMWDKQPIK